VEEDGAVVEAGEEEEGVVDHQDDDEAIASSSIIRHTHAPVTFYISCNFLDNHVNKLTVKSH